MHKTNNTSDMHEVQIKSVKKIYKLAILSIIGKYCNNEYPVTSLTDLHSAEVNRKVEN
jgi:hypothetical protein